MKKTFLILAILGASPILEFATKARAVAIKPHFLFVIVDDLEWQDLACYGSKPYKNSHMDSRSASGACFTQAYVSYPHCVPSRFAMMTGK